MFLFFLFPNYLFNYGCNQKRRVSFCSEKFSCLINAKFSNFQTKSEQPCGWLRWGSFMSYLDLQHGAVTSDSQSRKRFFAKVTRSDELFAYPANLPSFPYSGLNKITIQFMPEVRLIWAPNELYSWTSFQFSANVGFWKKFICYVNWMQFSMIFMYAETNFCNFYRLFDRLSGNNFHVTQSELQNKKRRVLKSFQKDNCNKMPMISLFCTCSHLF